MYSSLLLREFFSLVIYKKKKKNLQLGQEFFLLVVNYICTGNIIRVYSAVCIGWETIKINYSSDCIYSQQQQRILAFILQQQYKSRQRGRKLQYQTVFRRVVDPD
jgi:hypothetical protein